MSIKEVFIKPITILSEYHSQSSLKSNNLYRVTPFIEEMERLPTLSLLTPPVLDLSGGSRR